jgi:hypothetical protein
VRPRATARPRRRARIARRPERSRKNCSRSSYSGYGTRAAAGPRTCGINRLRKTRRPVGRKARAPKDRRWLSFRRRAGTVCRHQTASCPGPVHRNRDRDHANATTAPPAGVPQARDSDSGWAAPKPLSRMNTSSRRATCCVFTDARAGQALTARRRLSQLAADVHVLGASRGGRLLAPGARSYGEHGCAPRVPYWR